VFPDGVSVPIVRKVRGPPVETAPICEPDGEVEKASRDVRLTEHVVL